MLLADARGGAVVEHHAVFAQHDAVAHFADRECAPVVDVDAFEQFHGVFAFDVDLAEGGDVDQADVVAHRADFAVECVEIGFAAPRIELRAPPQSGIDESGAGFHVPRIHRGQAQGRDMRTAFLSRDRAERDGRVRRAERGGADLRYVRVEQLRLDRESVDVRQFALVGTHAEGCVALQVFDRGIAFARGESDVSDGDVVLEIDKAFVARAVAHLPQRF